MTASESPDFPNLSLSELREWTVKHPNLREKIELEIARRKIGRPKPRRYEIALENYRQAVKALKEVICKTDIDILSERLYELEDDCHDRYEAELIRHEFSLDRLKQRNPKKFSAIAKAEGT